MSTYLAFLRGINVGGKNIIKMEELRKVLSEAGFEQVRTYIQSGNVIFDSDETNVGILEERIEKAIEDAFNYTVTVMVRTLEELQQMADENPFPEIPSEQDVKLYVCFMKDKPEKQPELPVIIPKDGLELFLIIEKDAFFISRRIKTGGYGYPNAFVEKELKTPSTARNWMTVSKIIQLAEK